MTIHPGAFPNDRRHLNRTRLPTFIHFPVGINKGLSHGPMLVFNASVVEIIQPELKSWTNRRFFPATEIDWSWITIFALTIKTSELVWDCRETTAVQMLTVKSNRQRDDRNSQLSHLSDGGAKRQNDRISYSLWWCQNLGVKDFDCAVVKQNNPSPISVRKYPKCLRKDFFFLFGKPHMRKNIITSYHLNWAWTVKETEAFDTVSFIGWNVWRKFIRGSKSSPLLLKGSGLWLTRLLYSNNHWYQSCFSSPS